MTPKRFITAATLLGFGLNLAGCGGFVADHWPHWAGGLPADVPPRPGAPGYEEFVAHGQSRIQARARGDGRGSSKQRPAGTRFAGIRGAGATAATGPRRGSRGRWLAGFQRRERRPVLKRNDFRVARSFAVALFEYDSFRKPVSTFRDRAAARSGDAGPQQIVKMHDANRPASVDDD